MNNSNGKQPIIRVKNVVKDFQVDDPAASKLLMAGSLWDWSQIPVVNQENYYERYLA